MQPHSEIPHEPKRVICIGDTLVTVDGITYTEDAASIEEVATFIADSVTLS